MKKSIIKRRKRVVPAAQGSQASGIDASNSVDSPESDRQSPPADRGSINPDGSVNLGFRLRNDQQGRSLLPDPSSTMRSQSSQQLPSSDLTAYASTSNTHPQEHPESLNDDNRLPPMASYPSPNSFLPPSRKRSFSAAHMEAQPNVSEPAAAAQPKRLSSIKSILNPGFSNPDAHPQHSSDQDPTIRRSAGDRSSPVGYPGASSPGLSSGTAGYATSPANSRVGSALSSGRDAASEGERSRLERREMLQREAERMREALKAKERELAELGLGD